MSENSGAVSFLYKNAFGRFILKIIMKSHTDKIAVWFLRSCLSKYIIKGYAKRNNIPLSGEEIKQFKSFREFFLRSRDDLIIDYEPTHLISPCDGWLSCFKIDDNSQFAIKGSYYRIKDLINDQIIANEFQGGDCLIFRLCASDYHHYCYVDNGRKHSNNFIEGELHSVQPIACENYPVFTLNRRSWTLLETKNFGKVVETEIGALVVGGIVNHHEIYEFKKGEEKGNFDLCGSTIVLLFKKDTIELLPEITEHLKLNEEFRVNLGMYIANKKGLFRE